MLRDILDKDTEAAANTSCRTASADLESMGSEKPRDVHLIFIIHGHKSSPGELEWAALKFRERAAELDISVHVHLAKTLAGGTDEGIPQLARRVANELQMVVAMGPPSSPYIDPPQKCRYCSLSLYGQSLGGVIARYVVALAYDDSNSCIAGLPPYVFMTNVSPHLGVGLGEGGYVGNLPRSCVSSMCRHGSLTERQLMLLDAGPDGVPLLVRMARHSAEDRAGGLTDPTGSSALAPGSSQGHSAVDGMPTPPFLQALGSFCRRCVYANSTGDPLVAYQTAAIRPGCKP